MSTYLPMSGKQSVIGGISPMDVLTYDFRVVEHLDENDKVIKYVMQMQVWSHKPAGGRALVRDWHDVPRVQMKNGVIVNTTITMNVNVLPNGKSGQVITTTPNGT